MSKKIISVGFSLASPEIEYAEFRSKVSLLDWDIVLFRPDIDEFVSYSEKFQGKPSLSDSTSFLLKECCEHWRRELKQAVDTGKTVIVYLPPLTEVYVDTGKRTYSGTGRNQKTTTHVALYSNYEAIPASLSPVLTSGTAMKLVDRGSEILAAYWGAFEKHSAYQVLLTAESVPGCLVTRSGGKLVGALYRAKTSAGTLLCLPDIDFYSDEFFDEENDEWSKEGQLFSKHLVASIVGLDKALRSALEVTPEPTWASDNRFMLVSEANLSIQLLSAEKQVEEAQKRKEEVSEALKSAGALRALLYEKGKALEAAIIDALRLLGFKAESFKDSESEFDVVFECDEGRLIGEAEGKDNKAVNIDKLRQLSMNIHEDLQRDEVTVPAKAVLFGNGFRLQPLGDRGDPFTEKCHSAAGTASTALVFTPDLFPPVQYLVASPNSGYARACRQAILSSNGRVTFPVAPDDEKSSGVTQIEIKVDD
ncbi:hypothetical protein [Cupriavidus taiwanensis]|uniref:hypothetical protein n=1 Tax=Cupriavidus taiwanensis TaxID=164546 RepID=UPI001F119A25|nr:hypothetical protein [Cupriavidus taiwanensis]